MGTIHRRSQDCVDRCSGWIVQSSFLKRTARNPKTRMNPYFCPSVLVRPQMQFLLGPHPNCESVMAGDVEMLEGSLPL